MLTVYRITKLMGEAFKIHAQALIGYDDPSSARSGSPETSIPPHNIRPLELQAAY
jgi:hypothetical protein